MNFRNLSKSVFTLLTEPAKAWRKISHCGSKASMLNEYLYPLIMLCCLSSLIGSLSSYEWGFDGFYYAIVKTGVTFIKLFFAYHLSVFLVARVSPLLYADGENDSRCTALLTGYSMVVVLLLDLCLGLFPNFRIIGWILQFYTVKIVWDGVAVVMRIPEHRRFLYTMTVSLSVLVIPVLLGLLISALTKNLG